jgi:hypothetical protein
MAAADMANDIRPDHAAENSFYQPISRISPSSVSRTFRRAAGNDTDRIDIGHFWHLEDASSVVAVGLGERSI